jgi:predicted DNA-binding transcriptional regulator AlpA
MDVQPMTVSRAFSFEQMLNVEQFAAILGRTPKAIYDLRRRGSLPPAVHVGGKLYWSSKEIEAWMEDQREVV